MQATDLPVEVRTWRLLHMGVSLTEQGYSEPPAVLLDWLLEIEASAKRVEAEKARRASER